MVNVKPFDTPPAGMITVTVAVPANSRSLASTCAVSWLVLTKVVARSAPFHCTIAVLVNAPPLIVIVNPAAPAIADGGESPMIEGMAVTLETLVSQTLRPCVAANKLRLGCNFKLVTATRGRPVTRVAHAVPPLVV